MTQPLQPNLKGLPYAPAECVLDQDNVKLVNRAICDVAAVYDVPSVVPDFVNAYRQWIADSKLNAVTGLDKFDQADFSAGTSEAFDKFYLRHCGRRFRCFRGEYLYHRLAWESQNQPWAWLEDEPIAPNDAVVISLPFADLGSEHPDYSRALLDRCFDQGVPVLIDCAFFGICADVNFDFDHPAITDICFSLSKTFPVNTLRIGLRFSRSSTVDTLQIYNATQYVNRFAAAVGTKLLQHSSADASWLRWRDKQLTFCKAMRLAPSKSVIFGIDYDHRFDHYNRGMLNSNRLCFSRFYKTGKLVDEI